MNPVLQVFASEEVWTEKVGIDDTGFLHLTNIERTADGDWSSHCTKAPEVLAQAVEVERSQVDQALGGFVTPPLQAVLIGKASLGKDTR
ncbi:hypothetical protein [Microbacterium sp. 1P10AE]|uniref:hypothetical protein n=1 Tax=Microbacterium sp. 1P10AE TaxID=3132286 RepID=UPI0039A07167